MPMVSMRIEERGYKRGIAQSKRMLDEMRTTAKQDDIEKLAAYLRKTSPELSQEEAMKTAVSVLQ